MTQRVALSVLGLLVVVIWLVWFVTNRCEFETTPIRNDDGAIVGMIYERCDWRGETP